MKTKLERFQARQFSAVALGIGSALSLAASGSAGIPAGAPEDSAHTTETCIPWPQIGARAGANYQGDGLALIPAVDGARLRCVFQGLEGEATGEGLWITSTVEGRQSGRFRVMAKAVGREEDALGVPASAGGAFESFQRFGFPAAEPAKAGTPNHLLQRGGAVEVYGKLARFVRRGLTEEYTVSLEGLRQDFIIQQRPLGAGPLRVELDVAGAKVEPLADGARLVLENSGRKIAYSRLRVTDATGKELTARMEVMESDSESQRDSVAQPRVASLRATLGQSDPQFTTLKGLRRAAHRPHHEQNDATPLGLKNVSRSVPRVARQTRNPGLTDAIPLGLFASSADVWPPAGFEIRTPGEVFDEGVEHDTRGACATRLAVVVDDAEAVYPVRIDPTFSDGNWISMNPSIPGPDNTVWAAVVDAWGNLYIGGGFTLVGNVLVNNIAKWDGNSWTALGSGMNGVVFALAVSGSDVYAGGFFTTAGGNAANSIAKWDGSNWTALGSGMDTHSGNVDVRALAVSGSDLYAGGNFTMAGGSAANSIAKWNGSSWSALGSGMSIGKSPGDVFALAVSGSDLYAGGSFTTAGGKVSAYVARAYLLTLPALSVLGSGTDVMVSWPSVDTASFALEQTGTLAAPASWVTNTATVTDDGANKSVTVPATNSPQFFRLRRP